MEGPWSFVAFLPNVEVTEPVEWDAIGLFSFEQAIDRLANNNFQNLSDRFTDEFGTKIGPGVLLAKRLANERTITVESVASFRDAISLCSTTYNRARMITGNKLPLIVYSNSFWMYPWMWKEGTEWVASSTAAFGGLHRIQQLKGQSEPAFPRRRLTKSDLDLVLLEKISSCWRRHYKSKRQLWKDRALFRSLNMAHQAAWTPGGADMTFYDVGRVVALWVSAFEILAHPRIGRADLHAVYDLLNRASYCFDKLTAERYRAYGTKANVRSTLPCWLYGEIHRARNDFLHGNPISYSRLNLRSSSHTLFEHAAPLYRIALGSFLRISNEVPAGPRTESSRTLGNAIAGWIERTRSSEEAEKATLLSRTRRPNNR